MEISIKWSMCRTCTTERCSTLRPLFESEAVKHLNQHAGLVVEQNDGLPDQICADCVDKLEQAHRFFKMCKRSDEHLRNLVSKTMSSAASLKTTSVTDTSPPIQRKRARKQEVSAQTCISFQDYDTPNETLKKEENRVDFVEKSEADELLPIDKSLSTEEENRLVFDEEYIIMNTEERIYDNDFEATSSQGSSIAIHNGACSQEASEEESFGQKSDTASEDQHKCEICSKTHPNTSQLKSHMRKHLNEKSYECEVCGRRFNAACNLTSHMRTHTGEKPFICAYCERRFADHSSHRKHERIHTNERPYACNICGKAFALSTSLKAHYMTHSSEKPYKCQPCSKSFRLKHQLTAHEKTDAHRMGCGGLDS
ncbi:zinc finger protein 813 [Drosophila serrata]|uniref:zinc finger protein 813 n=1 Tax=Drosophila serrata TaxID=7274 RepID=UPI000A1D1C03|nr:zinc finger protein 813 [Drosophila serrata]